MISFISTSTTRHFIPPVVSIRGFCSNFKTNPQSSFISVKKIRGCEFKELKKTRTRSGVSCEGDMDSESEKDLDREILMFMKNSRNPNEFPSKEQLLNAGRVDLVNAIAKSGGWLALGWDCDEDEDEFKSDEVDDVRELRTSVEGFRDRCDVFDDQSLGSSSSSQDFGSHTGRSM